MSAHEGPPGRAFEDRLAGELAAYAQQLAGERSPDPLARAIALCAELRIALGALRLKLEHDGLDVEEARAELLQLAVEAGADLETTSGRLLAQRLA